MSKTTLDALDHANQSREYLAMQAIHLIGDKHLNLLSADGTEARYATANGGLTAHTRLNQSRYDVISIASPKAGPLYLSLPPPPVNTHEQASSMPSPLAPQPSRGQLTQAIITQPSGGSVSTQSAPLPSGDLVSTQSMVVSNNGSAASGSEAPGPSRNPPSRAARSTPYQQPSQPSQSQTTSQGRAAPRRGATVDQIRNHLYDDSGALRTREAVTNALHAAGLGARDKRIGDLLQGAGGVRKMPGAKEAEIREHLYDDEGLLRTQKEVIDALHASGLGARKSAVAAQLHDVAGVRKLPGATEAQLRDRLNNDNGSLRMRSEVRSALRAAGLGADNKRIQDLLNEQKQL